jgi:NADH-quinone oxidoreductase subunit E
MPVPVKQTTPMHFWISLWPQAPLFGVEWRYAKMFPGTAWFNPVDTLGKMAAAGVAETVKATEEAAREAAHAQQEAAAAMAEFAAEAATRATHAAAEVLDSLPAAVAPAHAEVEAPAPAEGPVPQPPATLFDIAPVDADDLKQLKGVGPKLAEMLNAMGIYRFDQIAGFSEANLAWVDQNLTSFKGRPSRDDWVAQAKALL